MRFPKYLITVTPLSKLIALSMLIVFPVLGFFLGYKYGWVTGRASVPVVAKVSKNAASQTGSPFDCRGGEPQKDLLVGKRNVDIGISFKDSENTKYELTNYKCNGDVSIKFYDLKIGTPNIYGIVEDISGDKYHYCFYESCWLKAADILSRELSQKPGSYGVTIYNEDYYEIYQNKVGFKFKKTLKTMPGGALQLTYERISGSGNFWKYDSFVVSKSEGFYSEGMVGNPFVWLKSHPRKEFKELEEFIETVDGV